MSNFNILFKPFAVKSLSMPNRIIMSPMGRASAPDGVLIEQGVPYYSRRARGGAGLVISEGTCIDRPGARNDPNAPVFHGPALQRWQQVLDAVHGAGAAMGQQLWHVGAVVDPRHPEFPAPFESPSGLAAEGVAVGQPMTEADIADTIRAYAEGARSARQMGYDMVELHAAHGYLIDEFFWAVTNRRSDRYNGSIAERTRFAVEILRAVREAVGPDFALSLRISQWKILDLMARNANTPAELAEWVQPLADAGVDIFHCSQRRFWEPEFSDSDLNFAGWVKKLTGRATITVGSVGLNSDMISSISSDEAATPERLDRLVECMERGDFDLVAVGRAMIANPDWADKVRGGRSEELRSFSRAMLATLE